MRRIYAAIIGCLYALTAQASDINNPLFYAKGPWTPTLVGSSTPGTGQTYSFTPVGTFEQIDRQVTLRFRIVATSLGTAAGNMQIGGLPLPAANITNDDGHCFISNYAVAGLPSLNYGVLGVILPNTSVVALVASGTVATTLITIAQAGNTPTFEGFCSYRAY